MAKPMVYKLGIERETLERDFYKGYEYVVISLGTHPCCYFRIPSGDKYSKYKDCDYDDIPLDVHGGITFKSDRLNTAEGFLYGCWIGWDYAHLGDYIEYTEELKKFNERDGKKWTTEELIRDCKDAIDQFIELCNAPEEEEKIEVAMKDIVPYKKCANRLDAISPALCEKFKMYVEDGDGCTFGDNKDDWLYEPGSCTFTHDDSTDLVVMLRYVKTQDGYYEQYEIRDRIESLGFEIPKGLMKEEE